MVFEVTPAERVVVVVGDPVLNVKYGGIFEIVTPAEVVVVVFVVVLKTSVLSLQTKHQAYRIRYFHRLH
jgi:hypothetical protein